MKECNKNVINNNETTNLLDTDIVITERAEHKRRVSQRTPRWKNRRGRRHGGASASFTSVRY
jgi:hypothetical protein